MATLRIKFLLLFNIAMIIYAAPAAAQSSGSDEDETEFFMGATPPAKTNAVTPKNDTTTAFTLKVFGVNGEEVLHKRVAASDESALSGCTFEAGHYSWLITDDKNTIVKKGSFSVQ